MKEFREFIREFIKEFNTDKSIEDIVTFFVDNEWFDEKLTLKQGKILLSDSQAKRFSMELAAFLGGTQETLYEQFKRRFPETDRRFHKFLNELNGENKKTKKKRSKKEQNAGKIQIASMIDEETQYHIIDFMLYRLEKDLFLYKDSDLEELISHATFDLTKAHGDIFTFFLAWMRLNYKTAYQKDYTLNKRYTMDIQSQAYDFDDYIQLVYYLFVEEYIEDNEMFQKAAESKNYTDTWLYLALHFVRPLRLTDMERIYHPHLPYPAEEVLERIKNGTFTNNDAKGVLLSVTKNMSWLPLTPNKTKDTSNVVPIVFDIPVSCEVMIGKLFALAQAHRDIIGKPKEPIIRKISTYQEITRYMGEEIGELFLYNDFRSISATKSFLQDVCMVADEDIPDVTGGFRVKGYYLAALARSHKGTYGEFARTTFEYLKDAKLSKLTPEFVAFEMLERGVFSFMSSLLLKMALGDDFERLSPKNQTKIIKTMDLSPKEIETIVTVVDNHRVAARKAIKDLITEDIDVLTVIHRISSGEAFSKQHGCPCLMTALRKPCPYSKKRLCSACEYGLATRTTFFEMASEYNRLKGLYLSADTPLEKAKYKNILGNVVITKIDEMLEAIKELYGEEVFNDYETLIKENT